MERREKKSQDLGEMCGRRGGGALSVCCYLAVVIMNTKVAGTFWRAAGMSYLQYLGTASAAVRNALKVI